MEAEGDISTAQTNLGEGLWHLPPLILHPFNERVPPSALLENSKAALMLSGLIPRDGSDEEELERRLLAGKYGEVRMLFYLGKDVFRWIDQCVDWAARVPELEAAGIQRQTFARLLTSQPPAPVREKLVHWGVVDHRSIFSRAIGLQVLFENPPAFDTLTEEFLRNYHRYADALFRCYLDAPMGAAASPARFQFELYASGEYSRLLESQWAAE
jgi:hypothetical protein